MPGPLAGIRVLDFTQQAAGPLCTGVLAEQGADVIKIERIDGGDPMRGRGAARGNLGAIFAALNRGKRSLALDLARDEGVELVRQLVGHADVCAQSFRPGVAERLGIGYAQLAADHPRLVYVSISGFGESGPLAQRPAYDSTIQAYSGMAALQGEVSGEPCVIGHVVCDKITGWIAAQAVCAALVAREREGRGQHVRLSMLDAAIAFEWSDGFQDVVWRGDAPTSPRAPRPNVRRCADGHLIVSANSERELRGLCAALEREDLLQDARFATLAARDANVDAFDAELERSLSSWELELLIGRLEEHGVPHAPVRAPMQLLTDAQVRANDLVHELDDPRGGAMHAVRPPARFEATPTGSPLQPPALGEHTEPVLAELGLDAATIRALRARGVVA
jgi:crotonobetainyl-CoA:carnitine CoA-transferase CaiB-like acyl-CoA transferase